MQIKGKSICVFTQRTSNAFRAVLKGITYAARERGWAVRTIELDHSAVSIHALLREWQPTGSLSYYLDPALFPKRYACIHINPKESRCGAWTVLHDSRATGDGAARALMKLSGRSFAFVGDATNAPWSQTRGQHFAQTLTRFGLTCSFCDSARAPNNPLTEQQHLIHWIKRLELPCAVFAANDETAENLLNAALAAGLQVPDDLAILGVDNDENHCENAAVTLSSIEPNFFRGGVLSCALLDTRINKAKSIPRSATYYGDLGVIGRASTRLQLKPNTLVAHMREFIRLHAAAGISATDVIRETGRQRRGIEQAFKVTTGKTIGEELQNIRLERTQRALADESIQIGQIPGLVGYVSQNQLERLFKRTFGMTMRDYRRKQVSA